MWTLVGVSAFAVIYWKFAQGQLESQKSAVMAKQRAIALSLGPKIVPFCNRAEAWVMELARNDAPDFVSKDLSLEKLRKGPGVYFRLRRKNAMTTESIREAAVRSLRDGFTSCLFVREEQTEGPACKAPSDCDSGKVCSDWGKCVPPSQPYNLRLAYRALRVLSPQWADDLHRATSDLGVRAFELDLDAVTRNDVPIAAELLTRSKYVTLVLDDEPKQGLPPRIDKDAPRDEPKETDEERLHRAAHPARVGIWDARSGQALLRLNAEASGSFVPVGERIVQSSKTVAAQQRQVNSCALALAVREKIEATTASDAPSK
jgi:hypothetical protein